MKRLFVFIRAPLQSWALCGILGACHAAPSNDVTSSDAGTTTDMKVGGADGSVADAAVDVATDSATSDSATTGTGGTDCAAACDNLVKLGCPEGSPKTGKSCLEVCNHTQSSHLTDLHPACIAAAKSLVEVRACKSVTCVAPASRP